MPNLGVDSRDEWDRQEGGRERSGRTPLANASPAIVFMSPPITEKIGRSWGVQPAVCAPRPIWAPSSMLHGPKAAFFMARVHENAAPELR